MAKTILLFGLIFVVIFICYHLFLNNPPPITRDVLINNQKYNLELASTIPQKTKGLMDRTSLCPNCGMIFTSNFEMPQAFWMKNTKIPLDIIFLDKNGTVINIEVATPQPDTPDSQLKLYRSLKPAQFVIELNAGDSSRLLLVPGDKIDLSPFQ